MTTNEPPVAPVAGLGAAEAQASLIPDAASRYPAPVVKEWSGRAKLIFVIVAATVLWGLIIGGFMLAL